MSRYSVVAVWTCPGRQAVEVAYSDVTLSALRNIWPTLAAVDLDEPGAVWCRQHTDEILARPRATTTKETP